MGIFKTILQTILKKLPQNNFIIFESSPDLGDNALALYEYFIEKNVNRKYKIIWFLNNENFVFPLKTSNVTFIYRNKKNLFNNLRRIYYEYTAKFIFDSNIFIEKKRNDQVRMYLGHGMPIKIVYEYCKYIGETSYIITTSEFFNAIYKDIFNTDISKMKTFGYPRNDVLLKANQFKDKKSDLFGDSKVAIWMPTYRQHSINQTLNLESSNIGIPCLINEEQLFELNTILKELNIKLLFRPHPAQDLSFVKFKELDYIILANNDYLNKINLNLYQLLSIMDALLTDYSSVYYDYLLTDKPIGLTIDDIDTFFKTFDSPFENYEENIIGDIIKNFSELKTFFVNLNKEIDDTYDERYTAKNKYHTYSNDESCKRIFEYLCKEHNL